MIMPRIHACTSGNYDFWYESSQTDDQTQMKEGPNRTKKEEKIQRDLQGIIQRFSARRFQIQAGRHVQENGALEGKSSWMTIRPSSRKYSIYRDFKPNRGDWQRSNFTFDGISKTIAGVKLL